MYWPQPVKAATGGRPSAGAAGGSPRRWRCRSSCCRSAMVTVTRAPRTPR